LRLRSNQVPQFFQHDRSDPVKEIQEQTNLNLLLSSSSPSEHIEIRKLLQGIQAEAAWIAILQHPEQVIEQNHLTLHHSRPIFIIIVMITTIMATGLV
ncbi:unnamed protein product, partial [Linum tenue]